MFKFVFQFLLILVLWLNNKKAKGSAWTSSSVLIGIYLVCSFSGILDLHLGDYTQPFQEKYWLSIFEFDFFLILFLIPFRLFKESSINKLVLPNKTILDTFAIIVIALSFYSIIFFASSVRNIFMQANLADARNSMVAGEEMFFEAGIGATIASVSAANYVFAIVLFFIYEIIGGSKLMRRLLLISSFSEPIHVLAFVGRDGIVFWIFTFVFCYFFFKPYLPKQNTKKLIRAFIVIGIVLMIPFLLISLSRFGDSDGGTGNSFVSYLGHSFIQAPLFLGMDNKPSSPGAVFPLFRSLLGMPEAQSYGILVIGDWISYKFSTFVVSLYISLGLAGLVVSIIFVYLITNIGFLKVRRTMYFSQFIVYLWYFQIIGQGVFYFRQYTRGGNLFILSCLALSILFAAFKRTGKPIVIERIY